MFWSPSSFEVRVSEVCREAFINSHNFHCTHFLPTIRRTGMSHVSSSGYAILMMKEAGAKDVSRCLTNAKQEFNGQLVELFIFVASQRQRFRMEVDGLELLYRSFAISAAEEGSVEGFATVDLL